VASYRSFKARGTESIPIFGEFGLANQLGCVEYSRPRRFRAMLEQWLDTIRAIWPQCPVRIISNGQNIEIRNATPIREQVLSPAGCALNCRHAREIGILNSPLVADFRYDFIFVAALRPCRHRHQTPATLVATGVATENPVPTRCWPDVSTRYVRLSCLV
jgi:hypothetical protein